MDIYSYYWINEIDVQKKQLRWNQENLLSWWLQLLSVVMN